MQHLKSLGIICLIIILTSVHMNVTFRIHTLKNQQVQKNQLTPHNTQYSGVDKPFKPANS